MPPNLPAVPQIAAFRALLLVLVVLCTTRSAVRCSAAITVNYHAGPGTRTMQDQSGAVLPDGNLVHIGTFTNGFDPARHATNLAALAKAWLPFDSTIITNIFAQPGRFAKSATGSNPAFDGRKIYWWIFKCADQGRPWPDFSNVEEYGLFTSGQSSWTFPANDDQPPANLTTVSSNDPLEALHGSVFASSLSLASAATGAQLTVADWKLLWFGTNQALAGDGADPDHDAMVNLAEYLLGGDPLHPNPGPVGLKLPNVPVPGESLLVQFTFRKDRSGATWKIQSSADLSTWEDVSIPADTVSETAFLRTVQPRISLTQPRGFFRLLVLPAGNMGPNPSEPSPPRDAGHNLSACP